MNREKKSTILEGIIFKLKTQYPYTTYKSHILQVLCI